MKHRLANVEWAREIYENRLEEDAIHAGAWHLLGVALNQKGNAQTSVDRTEHALSWYDSEAVYWKN